MIFVCAVLISNQLYSSNPMAHVLLLMLFLPRDASAEGGDATVSRLSVRLSVCDDQVS